MKKFTLLAAAALMAGSAFAQDAPAEINGLKLSSGTDTTQFQFYRITNMRAQRLDYTNGTLRNQAGDSINRDGGGFYMSPTLPDGVTPTPQISETPYMGLSNLDGNWWLSFANDKDIKDPDTEYWFFTWGGKSYPQTVYINNAVMPGFTVSDTAHKAKDLAGYSRSNMDFNSKRGNRYYVLPVAPAFETVSTADVNWTDSILKNITREQFDQAFALCLNNELTPDGDDCLDMNNYINIKKYPFITDPDNTQDTLTDEEGNKIRYRYGFAGVDRTWSPIRTTFNKNHWENNGAMFFVEPVTDVQEVMAAKVRYEETIKEGFRESAIESAKGQFAEARQLLKGWQKVSAIWAPEVQGQLKALADYCDTWEGDGVDVNSVEDPDTREAFLVAVKALADQKLNEAAKLVGTGCVVQFQNQLAIRDLQALIDGTTDVDLQLGNAFLAAGGEITYLIRGQNVEEIYDVPELEHRGVVPVLDGEENPLTEWELQPIPGTYQFRLYNDATKSWIRRYHDMYDFCLGEEMFEEIPTEISWATTTDIAEAAPFHFVGCADEEDQYQPTEDELALIGYNPDSDTEVANKVRLVSHYTNTVMSDLGAPITTEYTHNIHRASLQSQYKFVNWTPTLNLWYADSNAFKVLPVKQGGISEVGADNAVKSTGIYDLQGRRVNKATKGVYIINGVKTFVR